MPPLDGVRVIDLSSGISGGYCAKLLAGLGCDVVKVEAPGGDPLRRWSASGSLGHDGDPDGALFRFLYTSQRSVVADATTVAGLDAILTLLPGASLVIENWEPGVAESLRLGIDALRTVEPRVSLVSMSAFGRGGPMSNLRANEFLVQGWSGSISTRGTLDRPPLTAGGSLGEWATGTFGALAALTFLQQAEARGRGEHLDVSMLEVVMLTHTTYAPLFASYLGQRGVPNVRSIELPSIEPASDGWVGVCTISAQQFADFAILIGRAEWADDPAWSLQTGRQQRAAEFRAAVAEWTSQHTVAEIIELATLFRIPVVPIGNGTTVPELETFVERGSFEPNPRGGFLQPGAAYRFSDMAIRPLAPAPRLGEHDGTIEPAAASVPSAVAPWAGFDPTADKPLRGLRVADFTAYWAGPFTSNWLATMGADVIHIESPTRPDGMRTATTRPMSEDRWYEWGPVYASANTGKRGIAVDLTRPEGRDIALRIVAECDVVVENFTPRVMPGFGLGWDDLRAVRPDLIMVRMPAFGLTGPWTDRTGFAQTMEQVSGMAWRTGFADGQPLLPRGTCDPLAGAHAALALMAAIEHRRRTGRGQMIEVTGVEAALNVAAELVIEQQAYGATIGRIGNRAHHIAPQGCYRCADTAIDHERWVCISVETDGHWAALVAALGLHVDDALAGVEARLADQDAIDVLLGAAIVGRDRDDVVALLTEAGVPCAAVWPARCLDELEHPRARGFVESVDRALVGTHELWGMPVRALERTGWRWHERPAPTLGEHNDEVIGPLLGDDESLDSLRASGIIGDRWVTRR
ncbi:MAG: L-carnitine dehydratase/bile acid-inducible protein [Ilumatobacteraceae bacterium]|nr:L-carnitine dehydratase/bile acid-inducible protein [Ilumatobacteraceae bacterium]